nr:ADP-ribosylglycohydrolase family protein [Paracoccus liaowanqingii]
MLSGASPEETSHRGGTNGATMRIAPVGITTPPDPTRIVGRVAMTCRVTHNTGEAILGLCNPTHPVGCSNNIGSVIPGYPVS